MEWQRERFRTHIRAATATMKPLIVHTRSSSEDTLRIMAEERAHVPGGVMHCFTEPWPVAEQALAQNFHISLSGIVTFKNATDVQDVARRVPLERLLIETDSPYLAPVPYRGKPNEPAYVSHVGRFIAAQRGIAVEALADATTQNFSGCSGSPVEHARPGRQPREGAHNGDESTTYLPKRALAAAVLAASGLMAAAGAHAESLDAIVKAVKFDDIADIGKQLKAGSIRTRSRRTATRCS
jgi:hypothetical protein